MGARWRIERRKLLRRRRAVIAVVVAALLLSAGLFVAGRNDDAAVPERAGGRAPLDACSLPPEVLRAVSRGYYPGRSGDVIAVEQQTSQFSTRHSTPWPYTQDVPLLLYGPGFIEQGQHADPDVTVADIAPTVAELIGFDDFPQRDGRVLSESLLPEEERNGIPKLVMTVVWDGAGRNVLRQWPESWPELKKLMRSSANYTNATVGSSPSITPATHATIGTGAFPSTHGLPDIKMRVRGEIVDAWEGHSPRFLAAPTLADLWDQATGNAALVGLMARDYWHAGMIGHGSYLAGGDNDIAVLDALGALEFTSNQKFYTLPEYATSLDGLQELVTELDQRDGEADGKWLGNDLTFDGKVRETPAWSIFQTGVIEELLANEGFGQDNVPDLFFTNYKATDLAGHTWNMVEPEERDNLEEQDRQLRKLIEILNEQVGRDEYVLVMTADHGMTPYPEVREAWSINMRDTTADIEAEFSNGNAKPLIVNNRGYQLYLDRKQQRNRGISAQDVAAFLRDYRLNENLADLESVPEEFRERANQRVFATAMTAQEMKGMECGNEGD